MCATAWVWRSEDNIQELDAGIEHRSVGLGSKYPYQLSHLASPTLWPPIIGASLDFFLTAVPSGLPSPLCLPLFFRSQTQAVSATKPLPTPQQEVVIACVGERLSFCSIRATGYDKVEKLYKLNTAQL